MVWTCSYLSTNAYNITRVASYLHSLASLSRQHIFSGFWFDGISLAAAEAAASTACVAALAAAAAASVIAAAVIAAIAAAGSVKR